MLESNSVTGKVVKPERDEITVAKSIFDEIVEATENDTPKIKRAKAGGETRAKNLTPEKRRQIAKLAASARWKKSD